MTLRNSSIASSRPASVSASDEAYESACFVPSRLLHNATTRDEVDVRKEGYTCLRKMKDEQTRRIV